jgi:hypothetical protein
MTEPDVLAINAGMKELEMGCEDFCVNVRF